MLSQLAISVLVATAVLATPVAVEERQACAGYTPANQVLSVGSESSQYIMDVNDQVANPSSWDWNTTKIFYAKWCELDIDATHELSFVNLDDCSPVTTRYKRIRSMDRNEVHAYIGAPGPTIPVTADENATAVFPCYAGRKTVSSYNYEVHFARLHRSEMLAGLGVSDKIVN
ncbi:hypothetical protein BKA62DRAFT_786376 [Auriculariales sp. MPI-PUGE-AT-0066]|nr:hypothetical protein BKA62DRAFT_786376 [Auriculariales sp. MPI-PUGE-AT-0066]